MAQEKRMKKDLRRELETIAMLQNPAWEYLKSSSLPLVLWGAGGGARSVKLLLDMQGITIDFVVVDAPFYRPGEFFFDIPISRWEDVQKCRQMNVVIAFITQAAEKMTELRALPEVGYCLMTDASSFKFDPDFMAQNHAALETLFHALSDDLSRQVFLAFLRAKNLHSAEELLRW
ncbi:MAG: hypothetical protein LBF51_08935, partial [Zoogloeaceae bacterium]|nr:hypothetical protein [Zoogloeaceae bacterium]